MVLLYIEFCYLIPVNIYSTAPRLIAIFGAILTTASLFLLISSFSAEKENTGAQENTADQKENPAGNKKRQLIDTFLSKTILAIVCISFFSFLYNIKEHEMERRETDQYGELAEAKITGLSILNYRRPNVADLTVVFKTKNGQSRTSTMRMPEKNAAVYHINQEVFILYSTRYPDVIRILVTGEELKKIRSKK